MGSEQKRIAEQLFRAVYGGDLALVDTLTGQEIVASYPVFARLFGTPAIRGLKQYQTHAVNFQKVWADCEIVVHDSLEEGDRVVLVWSFEGRFAGSSVSGGYRRDQVYRWGGITLFRFDAQGKVVAEIGEESDPGPYGRLQAGTGGEQ